MGCTLIFLLNFMVEEEGTRVCGFTKEVEKPRWKSSCLVGLDSA